MPGTGKFCRVDRYLRIAVGLEFPELPVGVTVATPGVAEIRPYAKRNSQKVYFNLEKAGIYPQKIEVRIPEDLEGAPWGEVLFNNNRTGALVSFAREEEEMLFGPTEGKYTILRLYQECSFKTVYVCVEKGPETRYFAIKAGWYGDTITIEIEPDPNPS